MQTAEELKANFLRVNGDFVLAARELGHYVSGGVRGRIAENFGDFWNFDKLMIQRRKAYARTPHDLLKLNFDAFDNFWEYDPIRHVVESIEAGRFESEKYGFLTSFLDGEVLTVKRNKIHVKTTESFLGMGQGNLEKAFRALMENWTEIPTLSKEKSDYVIEPVYESLRVENLRKAHAAKEAAAGAYSFSFYFDYNIRYRRMFEKKWNPDIYREPGSCYHKDRTKLIWDILHYNDKIKFVHAQFKYGDNVYLRPTYLKDYVSLLGFFAIGEDGLNFMDTFNLLDEFLEDGKYREPLNKLENFQKGKYLYGKESASLFARKIKEMTLYGLEWEAKCAAELLEGLNAAEHLVIRFAEETGQGKTNTLALKKGLGGIIAKKIMLDPTIYANDDRPYIANFARAVISGEITPDN